MKKLSKCAECLLLAYNLGYRCDDEGNVISPKDNNLKLYTNSTGYFCFSIRLNTDIHHRAVSRAIPVHRLQAYQIYGDKIFERGIHVRHINSNCLDNSRKNIGIGSASDNMMDKPLEIRVRCAVNASSTNRKFTDDEMGEIKTFYNECKSYHKTMEKFKIPSKGSLHYMLNRKYVTNKVKL
jgi:hypothetical protein